MAASPEYSSLEIFMGRMTAVGLRWLRLGLRYRAIFAIG